MIPVQNVSVFVQGIGLAVCLKAAFTADIGDQGRLFQGKAGLCLTVCGADNVLIGNGNIRSAGGDGIKILSLCGNLIGHILIIEGLLALHLRQQELCLLRRAKLLPVCHGIAEVLILDHAYILLIHIGVGVELLILLIGADESAHKRKQEHGDQHTQAHHCQTVPEKPLGNQCAGRQHLDAAVVI